MDDLEFKTLLRHLGQDVGYMSLKLKKDVQKCVNELDLTHDSQRFCQKLVDIFTKLSANTIGYAKSLEERIKGAGKEQEYDDIIKSLHQLTCETDGNSRNSGNDTGQNGEYSVLKPPSTSDDFSLKDIQPKLDLNLSQCGSIHIGDEIKEEPSTQICLNDSVPVDNQNDHVDVQEDKQGSEPKSEPSSQLSTNASQNAIINDAPNEETLNNDKNDLDNTVANIPQVALSEDVPEEQNAELNATVESQSSDDIFDKETVANSPPRLDASDDQIAASVSDEYLTPPCGVDNEENSLNLDDTVVVDKDSAANESSAPQPELVEKETTSNPDDDDVALEQMENQENNANQEENIIKSPLVPEANLEVVTENDNNSSSDSDVLIIGDFPVKIKTELAEDQETSKNVLDSAIVISDSSNANEDKSDDSDIQFVTCTVKSDEKSMNLGSLKIISEKDSSHLNHDDADVEKILAEINSMLANENVATSKPPLPEADVSSNKEDASNIVAENLQPEIIETSKNQELEANPEPINTSEASVSKTKAVSPLPEQNNDLSDSDTTLPNLTPPKNRSSESDDTVIYENSPSELSDEQTNGDLSEVSQVFSVPRQSDKDENVANLNENDVDFNAATQMNVINEAGEQLEKSHGVCDTPQDIPEEAEDGNRPSLVAEPSDVAPHCDSDVDYDRATQSVNHLAKVIENDALTESEPKDGTSLEDGDEGDDAKVDFLKSLEMVPVDASGQALKTNRLKNTQNDNIEQNSYESDEGSSSSPVALVETVAKEGPKTISERTGGDLKLAAAVVGGDSDVLGDVSESESSPEEDVEQKRKKKLKDKDRKSLLKLISEYYRKRKKENLVSDKDNDSSSGDDRQDKKKRLKSNLNKGAKRKGSPMNHRKDEAKKRPHLASDALIDQSSSSSSDEFTKDNMDIQDSSNDSEASTVENNAQKDDEKLVGGNEDLSTDNQEIIGAEKETLNDNDSKSNDASPTQTQKTDDESLADESQVVNPYKRKSVVPLPNTQSEEDASEPPASLSSQDSDKTIILGNSQQSDKESEVVCPFKRKSVQPIPSSGTSEFDDSQVIGCKRKSAMPLPSSQSDEETEINLDDDKNEAKRPRSPIESNSDDDTEDVSTVAVNGTDDSGSDVMMVSSSVKASDDHHVHKKRKVDPESNQEDSRQANEDRETDDSEDSSPPPSSQFKLDDDGRNDLLEMLDQLSKETHHPATEDDAAKGDEVVEAAETPAPAPPASQFKLCDSDRDNLLNLLTDKEKDNSSETSDDRGDEASKKDEVGLSNADRNELLDLLNDVGKDAEKDSDTSETSEDDEIETIRDSDDKPDDENSDNPDDRFKLDEKERNELLNLLSEHLKDGHSDSSDVEGSDSSSDSGNDDASAGQKRRASTGDSERLKRKKKPKGVDRDVLLDLVNEYEDAVTKGTDDKELVAIKRAGKMGNLALDMDDGLDLLRKCDISADEDSNTDSILLDVLREEAVEESDNKKSGKSKDENEEAWNAYQALLEDDEDEDISETSSEISDIDLHDLELDFADQEKRRQQETRNAELRKQFGISKELVVDVEVADISGFDISDVQPATPSKEHDTSNEIDSDISSELDDDDDDELEVELDFRSGLFKAKAKNRDRVSVDRDSSPSEPEEMDDGLCDLSDVLLKKTTSARLTKRPRSRSSSSSSSDASQYSSPRRKPSSDWSDSEPDDSSPFANQTSFSNPNSPLHRPVSDDDERDRFANALFDNIKNSSDENSGDSEGGDDSSSDEEEKKKTKKKRQPISLGADEVKSKKKSSDDDEDSDSGPDSDGSENNSETDNNVESGDQEKKEKVSKEVDLDSSDEEDFVGVRKGRGAWRYDPLLHECLTSDSDEETDGGGSPKKQQRKRKENKAGRKSGDDSDSDNASIKSDDTKTPVKKSFLVSDDSDDSDFEIIEKEKTPQKPILITDDEDTPSKWGKGRRNIRALVQDDDLAEATQKAHNEERERIRRLQERDKAKETLTQSQSFSSQLSEDEPEPLFLDMNEDIQIKVHPKITQKLKPHQRDGIQFMWDSCYESIKQLKKGWQGSGCILAHCMGLGKTLQALALIQTLFTYSITKTKHVLVVCPLSTVSNWRNEYNLAFKNLKHSHVKLYTIENKKAARRRFEIVHKWWKTGGMLVMGYECFGLLINEQKLNKYEGRTVWCKESILKAMIDPGPDLIICDEGHLLRNKQSQRTLALNRVKTRRRIVLTGTPLQNNLLEYYYMVHFVKPNLLGTEKEYKTNFVNPISNGQFEDSTAEDIMFMKKRTHVLHKLLNRTVQRVEDTELKQYLPKLIDQAVFVKLSDLQVNLYNTYLDSANSRPVVYTKTGNISHKNFLADVQILRYICIHPDVVTTAEKNSNSKSNLREQDVVDDNNLDDVVEEKVFSRGEWYKGLLAPGGSKKLELGSKMVVVLDIVKEAASCGDKVLIFSQSYAEMDNLEYFLTDRLKFKKFRDYYRMDGTISPELRTHMCDKFNKKTNTKVKVFIMSTKVGGLGLNLTAANRVIIMNVNWNPSYDTQSVFRSFRFGQKKAVYVYRLIAKDTMEEKMYQRVVTKLAIAHRVVDKHQITRHYSAADIQEFYSVRPTLEKNRPVPNLPEDRVLATLIQKRPFVYRWHEHQALLANRPEEDLDEHQKNAAWEEFNKKEPPPPVPGIPQTPVPNYVTASSILAQAGPSGLQNRANLLMNSQFMTGGAVNTQQPKANGQNKVNAPLNMRHKTSQSVAVARRRSERLNKLRSSPPAVVSSARRQVFADGSSSPQNRSANTYSLMLRQTLSGPKLVFTPNNFSSAKSTEIPLKLASYAAAPGNANTNTSSLSSNTIRIINELTQSQANSAHIAELGPTSVHNSSSEDEANGIEEFNTLISESLSQESSWANDGLDETLANLNFPEPFCPLHPDHNYSLPKNSFINFRTSSSDDFLPVPSKILSIPRSVFVKVPFNGKKIRANLQGYPMNTRASALHFQKTISSSDDFRKPGPPTAKTYQPRRVFVDRRGSTVTRVINPMAGQRTHANNNNNQSVRLGSDITITRDNGQPNSSTTLNAQKPSVTITPSLNNNNLQNLKTNPTLTENVKKAATNQKDQNNTRLNRVNWPPQKYIQQKKIHSQQNGAPSQPIVVTPPLTKPNSVLATATSTVQTISITDTVSSSPTNSNSVQSPLQKQMRSYMDHLHLLQTKMREKQTGNGQVSAASTSSAGGVASLNNTIVTSAINNGQRPGSLTGSITDKVALNAARDLSNFNKALQKLSSGLSSSKAPIVPTSSSKPAMRFMGSLPNQKNVVTSRTQINGVPGVKRLVNKMVPISPGAYRRNMLIRNRNGVRIRHLPHKKVIIPPKNSVAQNSVSLIKSPVRAMPTNSPLQRKMVANLNKLASGGSPSLFRSQLKNGTSPRTYQNIRKNGPSPRANSLSSSPSAAIASKSNKENIKRRRLSFRAANYARIAASIDLSQEDDAAGGSLSQEVVDTLKKKGISINYVEPSTETDVIKLD